jgi:dsRNA-specific ribonuclease
MDLFEEYLDKREESIWVKRALMDRSYKKEYQKNKGKTLPKDKTNEDLATYGDAVIKLGYVEILFDTPGIQLTEEKKQYESDEFFVTVIAKHYKLLNYIRIDSSDSKIAIDYVYNKKKEPKKSNTRNPHKYIATAVEAMIGAIYMEEGKKLEPIIELLEEWKENKDAWINNDQGLSK